MSHLNLTQSGGNGEGDGTANKNDQPMLTDLTQSVIDKAKEQRIITDAFRVQDTLSDEDKKDPKYSKGKQTLDKETDANSSKSNANVG